MARQLNSKQKKLLETFPEALLWEDLSDSARDALKRSNDYETLEQDAERYLWDSNAANIRRQQREQGGAIGRKIDNLLGW